MLMPPFDILFFDISHACRHAPFSGFASLLHLLMPPRHAAMRRAFIDISATSYYYHFCRSACRYGLIAMARIQSFISLFAVYAAVRFFSLFFALLLRYFLF